jgi:hypothetical protein
MQGDSIEYPNKIVYLGVLNIIYMYDEWWKVVDVPDRSLDYLINYKI